MIFNNISTEKKMEALIAAREAHEQSLYDSILRVGIDPEEFDMNTFDPDDENHPKNSEEILKGITKSISSLNIVKKEMDSLEI